MITVNVIKPRVRLSDYTPKIEAALKKANEAEAGNIVADLNATTRTWSKRPRFIVRISKDAVRVRTEDRIWNMLDQGTKPHDIYPKRGRFLWFQVGYRAKTRRGFLGSEPGGASGAWVPARRVRHPGTYAREWTQAAQRESAKRYPAALQAAIKEALS